MTMPPSVCILCGTNEYARELYPSNVSAGHLNPEIFSARRMPDRVHGRILRCGTCGLVYASPLVDPAILSALYEKSKFTYGGQETFIRKTYARYLKRLVRTLEGQPKPWVYLDVGCGNGFMLPVARELGFEDVRGVEPSSDAIAKADPSIRAGITQGMFREGIYPENTFDAISCFQTLDHLPDPVSFVRECLRILKPGGAVLFINHNIASWSSKILGERCPMIDIEHTYLHTPHTMRLLFGREGFTDFDAFSVRNDYPLRYWLHLLPFPAGAKNALIRMVNAVGLGGLIIPFYPGNLGLIARKPE